MTFNQFLSTLRKRWAYVVVLVLLSCAVVSVGSKLSEPVFTARASAYFGLRTGATPGELYQGSNYTQQQIGSYAILATKPIVLDPVIERLGLQTDSRELGRSVTAKASVDTVIVEVSVDDPSADRAALIANAIVSQLGDVVVGLSPKVSGQPSVQVTIVAVATPPQYQSSPNTRRNVLIAALAGLFLGLLAALAREHLDTGLRDGEELPERVSVLGALEEARRSRGGFVVLAQHEGGRTERLTRENLRRVRTNLKFLDVDRPIQAVAVTSCVAGEGKTSVAINLADALAEDGLRVLLVDADMRRPKVAQYLDIDGSVGLVDVLRGSATLADATQSWSRHGQFVLTSGSTPPNPAELLDSDAMAKLVDEFRREYEFVVIDSPPLLPVIDATIISRLTDGALVVVRHGHTTRQQFQTAIEAVRAVHGRVLGSVFNRTPVSRPWSRRSASRSHETSPRWE